MEREEEDSKSSSELGHLLRRSDGAGFEADEWDVCVPADCQREKVYPVGH